jgi:tetratricopeptide (TPR) repeat protein
VAGFRPDGVLSYMAAEDPEKLAKLFEALAEACNGVTPVLKGHCDLVQAIGTSVEALVPRLDEAIAGLREAIQAQTRLLTEAAASLRGDAGDAVTALEGVPGKAEEAGASLDGLHSALQKAAQTVAEARAGYAQVVSTGVDALELALEKYGKAAEDAARNLAAGHKETTTELQGLASTLDATRADRVEEEGDWAEAIDTLVEAAAEAPKALAVALADGADEVASALVATVNGAIDAYHELVAPWGPVYPRFMVEDGDAFTTARDALTETLEELGERVAQREQEVTPTELTIVNELIEVGPAVAERQDQLRVVGALNQ